MMFVVPIHYFRHENRSITFDYVFPLFRGSICQKAAYWQTIFIAGKNFIGTAPLFPFHRWKPGQMYSVLKIGISSFHSSTISSICTFFNCLQLSYRIILFLRDWVAILTSTNFLLVTQVGWEQGWNKVSDYAEGSQCSKNLF